MCVRGPAKKIGPSHLTMATMATIVEDPMSKLQSGPPYGGRDFKAWLVARAAQWEGMAVRTRWVGKLKW